MIGIMGGGNIYQIYIDSYFLFHFSINFWILFLCRLFLISKVKVRKIIFLSILMALGESIFLIITFGKIIIKLALGLLGSTMITTILLFHPKTYTAFFRSLVAAYSSALLLGGSLVFFQRLFPIFQRKLFLSILLISGVGICLFFIYKFLYKDQERGIVEAELHFLTEKK